MSGSVVDSEGKPLPEVQVSLKPTVEGDSVNFDYTNEQVGSPSNQLIQGLQIYSIGAKRPMGFAL